MDQEEIHIRILMREYLEQRELKASSATHDLCADMESDEMRCYIHFLLEQFEEKQIQMNRIFDDLSELKSTSKEYSKMLDSKVAIGSTS